MLKVGDFVQFLGGVPSPIPAGAMGRVEKVYAPDSREHYVYNHDVQVRFTSSRTVALLSFPTWALAKVADSTAPARDWLAGEEPEE